MDGIVRPEGEALSNFACGLRETLVHFQGRNLLPKSSELRLGPGQRPGAEATGAACASKSGPCLCVCDDGSC